MILFEVVHYWQLQFIAAITEISTAQSKTIEKTCSYKDFFSSILQPTFLSLHKSKFKVLTFQPWNIIIQLLQRCKFPSQLAIKVADWGFSFKWFTTLPIRNKKSQNQLTFLINYRCLKTNIAFIIIDFMSSSHFSDGKKKTKIRKWMT